MKITEIYESVINTLHDKKFIGNFEVVIYHPYMADVKITGHKRTDVEFPYDFSCSLQNAINEICFKIVSGNITNGDFAFDIKGQIAYLYTGGIEDGD